MPTIADLPENGAGYVSSSSYININIQDLYDRMYASPRSGGNKPEKEDGKVLRCYICHVLEEPMKGGFGRFSLLDLKKSPSSFPEILCKTCADNCSANKSCVACSVYMVNDCDIVTYARVGGDLRFCPNCYSKMSRKCKHCQDTFIDIDHLDYFTGRKREYCNKCIEKYICALCYNSTEVTRNESLNVNLCKTCNDKRLKGFNTDGNFVSTGSVFAGKPSRDFPFDTLFGLEIEAEKDDNFDDYGDSDWKRIRRLSVMVGDDGSLHDGIEIRTYPASGIELERYLKQVTRTLQRSHLSIKQTCGLHVHMDARSMTRDELKKFIRAYTAFEDVIFDMLPPSRRHNEYCERITEIEDSYDKDKAWDKSWQEPEEILGYKEHKQKFAKDHWSRHMALNVHSYFYRGTIEFRHHSGTLDYEKMKNWINIVYRLVTESLKLPESKITELRKQSYGDRKEFFRENILRFRGLIDYYDQRSAKFKDGSTNDNESYSPEHVSTKSIEEFVDEEDE